ncbi:MAG: mechanosensitive ion channel [Elusimicrobia bacterium]|nr:MAG: mechanosensitive ion channel [Elusimicrobiota bacterium]
MHQIALQAPYSIRRLLFLLLYCVLASAAADDTAQSPIAALNALQERIGDRLAALGGDTKLEPATRDAVTARLKQAQQLISTALNDRNETSRRADERLATPRLLAEMETARSRQPPAVDSEPWGAMSIAQLEIHSSEVENLARDALQRTASLRQQLAETRHRRPLLGGEMAATRDALGKARQEAEQLAAATQSVSATGSEALLAEARVKALQAKLALLEEQSDGAELHERLLSAQAQAAEDDAGQEERRLRRARDELARRRLAEAVAGASAWRDSPLGQHPTVVTLADTNRELASQYAGQDAVIHRLDATHRDLARLEQTIAWFEADVRDLRSRLDGLGRSPAAGLLIRQARQQLPTLAALNASLQQRRAAINETQWRMVALASEERQLERELTVVTDRVVAQMGELSPMLREQAARVVSELLTARLSVLRPFLRDLDRYRSSLDEMQAREATLLAEVGQVADQLRSREPWVRNHQRALASDLPAAFAGAFAAASPKLWAGGLEAMSAAAAQHPESAWWHLSFAGCGLVALLLLPWWRKRALVDSRLSVARLLIAALLNAIACLGVALAVGTWLAALPAAPIGLHALGGGLVDFSPGITLVAFLSTLCARQGGAGSVRPAMAAEAVQGRALAGYLIAILATAIASRVLVAADTALPTGDADLGARLFLMLGALLIVIGHYRFARASLNEQTPTRPRHRVLVARLLLAAALAIPTVCILLLMQGFTIGALELLRALFGTVMVFVVVNGVRRLLLLPRTDGDEPATPWISLRHAHIDLLHVCLTLVLVASLLWVWRELFDAFGYLRDIPLWTAETVDGLKTVTVASLLSFLGVLAGTLFVFWALPRVFATAAEEDVAHGMGGRYAAVALVRYAVLIGGLAMAFSLLNIGWSKLQWMAAGLSVGLGFGLQDIVANFFSGLILLSERSVRVGDLITVGDKTGVVARIRVRSTTLRDPDGRDIVIPNKDLVATQVTNWTLANLKRRLQVVVGVAYGSDTALVEQKLLDAARSVDGVLADSPPRAVFDQFGDSALQFRVYVWIDNPDRQTQIKHDLHTRINQTLQDAGIEMAYPQRDIHLFSSRPLDVRIQKADERTA